MGCTVGVVGVGCGLFKLRRVERNEQRDTNEKREREKAGGGLFFFGEGCRWGGWWMGWCCCR